MRRIFFILLICLISTTLSAADVGSLAIVCEPGFTVLIDDVNFGITTEKEQGKIVAELSAGEHSLSIKRDGYLPQNLKFRISAGETTVLRIDPARAGFKVKSLEQESVAVDRATGNIIVRSLPVGANVTIDNMDIGKTDAEISDFPTGRHTITFIQSGRTLTSTVELENGDTLNILANFINNDVQINSRLAGERSAQAEEARRKEAAEALRRTREREQRQREDMERKTRELKENSRIRIVVNSFPDLATFQRYVSKKRDARARVVNSAMIPESKRETQRLLGGLDRIKSFSSKIWQKSGNPETLKNEQEYGLWISTPKFAEYEKIDGTTPKKTTLANLVGYSYSNGTFFIRYTDLYILKWMFKTYSANFYTHTTEENGLIYEKKEIELLPGDNELHVDILIQGDTMTIDLDKVVHFNPLDNSKRVVNY